MAEEKVLLEAVVNPTDKGFIKNLLNNLYTVANISTKITNARFIVGTKTYALNTVSSVEPVKVNESINILVLLLLGIFTIFLFGFGILLLIPAVYIIMNPLYAVQMITNAREASVLTSRD